MKKTIPFDIKYRPEIESGEMKVQTRDGREVRIVCWDATDVTFPIMGYIKNEFRPDSWMCDGSYFMGDESCSDLVLVPVEDESEDERIRERLMNAITTSAQFTYALQKAGFEEKEVLAWLERQKDSVSNAKYIEDVAYAFEDGRKKGIEEQKEQKPSIFPPGLGEAHFNPILSEQILSKQKPSWSEEDENVYNGLIKQLERTMNKEDIYEISKVNGYKVWLRYHYRPKDKQEWSEEDIKKIRSEEYTKGFNDCLLGKKKGWSEEDERNIRNLESILYYDKKLPETTRVELGDFLKSLRPQPKVEWGEEDEHRRIDAIYFLESAKKHYADTSEVEKTIDWLKSLPERLNLQPKQEWSEEDEMMLVEAIADIADRKYMPGVSERDFKAYEKVQNWLKSLPERFGK